MSKKTDAARRERAKRYVPKKPRKRARRPNVARMADIMAGAPKKTSLINDPIFLHYAMGMFHAHDRIDVPGQVRPAGLRSRKARRGSKYR